VLEVKDRLKDNKNNS